MVILCCMVWGLSHKYLHKSKSILQREKVGLWWGKMLILFIFFLCALCAVCMVCDAERLCMRSHAERGNESMSWFLRLTGSPARSVLFVVCDRERLCMYFHAERLWERGKCEVVHIK